MIPWLIVAGVIIVALIWLEVEKKFKWVKILLLVVLIAVLYFSFVGVSKSQNLDFSSPRGVYMAFTSYISWIGETGKDLFTIGKDTVTLVGNTIKENRTDEF